jgi:3-hydroxymyristoyl/3-hydroxydecanoyl-(acyl carrier protein) dehydratase
MIRQAGAERDDEHLGFRTLDALDALYSLRPSVAPADEGLALLEAIASSPIVGLATRIDVRFLEPVFPGSRLDYRVDWTLEQNGVMGFEVEASVGGRPVARGELGASINTRIPLR